MNFGEFNENDFHKAKPKDYEPFGYRQALCRQKFLQRRDVDGRNQKSKAYSYSSDHEFVAKYISAENRAAERARRKNKNQRIQTHEGKNHSSDFFYF